MSVLINSKWIQKIPFHEFTFEVTRSRGPGGQNVNRTNSAVILRWDYQDSGVSTEEQKRIISNKLANMINVENEIYIRSEESRDQDQNKKLCLNKLEILLQKAFFVPKKRIKTRPSRSSVERRIKSKKKASEIKKHRQTKWDE